MTELIEQIGKNIYPWNACVGYSKHQLLKDIESALATARAEGAAEENERIYAEVLKIEVQDYIDNPEYRQGAIIYRDEVLEALTTKEHHAS